MLAVYSVKTQKSEIQFKNLEIKTTEAKLIELNSEYEKVLKAKTETDAEKQEQLKKIEELQKERERLQIELQAKINNSINNVKRLTQSAQNSAGIGTSVASGKIEWMQAAGIPESDWTNVDFIVTRESGWNPNAVNKSSGACGLGQQLPCGKWAGAWNDPVAALIAMTGYVNARYGGWAGAVSFWNSHNWY